MFWAEAYGDDVGYLLAFREVVALLVQYVQAIARVLCWVLSNAIPSFLR
jgi:hypothetical protein